MRFKTVKVLGLNTDQQAAQAISAATEDGYLFFGVVSLVGDDAFTKGRQLLNDLSDAYLDPASAGIEEISNSERLTKVFSLARNKVSEVEKFDLLLAVVSSKVLYIISEGEVDVFLKRFETLSSLIKVGGSSGLISGFLQEGDRVLFATNSLVSFLGENLKHSIEMPLDSWEEDITSKLAVEGSESEGLAGLLLSVEDEQPTQIPKTGGSVSELESRPQEDEFNLSDILSRPEPASKRRLPSIKLNFKKLIPGSGKARLVLALVLLLVILGATGYKYKSNKEAQKNVQFSAFMQQARDNLSAAQSLQTLSPQDVKSKLDLAKNEVDAALAIKPGDGSALQLKKDIQQNGASVLQQYNTSFTNFLDLNLIKQGFSADKFTLSGSSLLLLDNSSKSLVVVDINKKSNQVLAGADQLGSASLASINGSFAFVYSLDKGVLRIDSSNKKVTAVAKNDKEVDNVSDLTGFGSNVYLLSSGKNQIWKYTPTSSGYSDKIAYLTSGTKADFNRALRMQIESSVYVLKKGGEISRFTKGAADNFSLSGLDKGVKDPKSIFISSDTDNLYILDSGNSRLVVVTKIGAYKAQYQGDRFGTASDLVVDEKGKKVYLLDGNKIYTMDLK